MKRKFRITSDRMYHETMVKIFDLMNKGEQNLTRAQTETLEEMAKEAERYEDDVLDLLPRKPKTISEMVELKMKQENLTQTVLADKLGIGKAKLSQILNGKRRPDIAFLKGIYKELHIDPAFLLEKA